MKTQNRHYILGAASLHLATAHGKKPGYESGHVYEHKSILVTFMGPRTCTIELGKYKQTCYENDLSKLHYFGARQLSNNLQNRWHLIHE